MKVGLYTFGGSNIGTGHLFRCIAFMKWLEKLSMPVEASVELIDLDPDGPEIARNVFAHRTSIQLNIHQDSRLSGRSWDLLFVDRLEVAFEDMRSLRERAQRIISIDDVGLGRSLADVALNPLYAARGCKLDYNRSFRDFQGPEFQIIQPAFCEKPSRWRDVPTDLLITQGGADPHGLAPLLVNELEPLRHEFPLLKIHVLTGPAFKANIEMERLTQRLSGKLIRHSDETNMPKLLRSMDLAISAAGVAPFELAALGLPAVLVTGEAKEVETADAIARTGAAISLGLYPGERQQRVIGVVRQLLQTPSKRLALRQSGLARLNGRTGERLVQMIEEWFLTNKEVACT